MKQEKTLCDLTLLKQITCDDEAALKNMIKIFLGLIKPTLAALERAIKSQDFGAIEGEAHRFKTNIEVMGITSLQENIDALETLGHEGMDMAAISQNFESLKAGLENVSAELTPVIAV